MLRKEGLDQLDGPKNASNAARSDSSQQIFRPCCPAAVPPLLLTPSPSSPVSLAAFPCYDLAAFSRPPRRHVSKGRG
eukprot:759935-Hanusia_phi.AAC.7